jgi:hypothetical protein
LSKTDEICKNSCAKNSTGSPTINSEFNTATGARSLFLVSGLTPWNDCCLVADVVKFTGDSQLVFGPSQKGDLKQYCPEYFVVCRKLVIEGGHEVKDPTPCNADDPGHMYSGNNVITWADRLVQAKSGIDKAQAGDGNPNFQPDDYQDQGQGDDGKDGGAGHDGEKGNDGTAGMAAPSFTILAVEVEAGVSDHLTIDFDGQNGGDGGKGQKGGNGGHAMRGKEGASDTSWPGEGCDRSPGDGGNGGDGGDGGKGGQGGRGGNAGKIVVVSTPTNIAASGVFTGTKLTYVNDGGDGGKGGKGGMGGKKGQGAKAGKPTQECNPSVDGTDGQPGSPETGDPTDDGGPGGHGASGGVPKFEVITAGTCADQIPIPFAIASVSPNSGAQGTTVDPVTITGVGFDLAATVDVSGLGITATVKPIPAQTSTQITCTFVIGGAALKTSRDVKVKNSATAEATLTNGFTVT